MTRRHLLAPSILTILVAGLALAQPGAGRPGGQPGNQPGGQPGPGPRGPRAGDAPPFDPQQFIDRLMAGDADGDGKLARSEVSGPIASRFDSLDANGDGFLDRGELTSAAGAFGGGGRMRVSMERAMESAEDALHALQDSALDASTLDADLAQVQAMQEGLLAAKFHIAAFRFDAAVLEHFEGDEREARMEMREHMIQSIDLALDLEVALMDGDAEAARQTLAELEELEDHSHEEFRVD
jgi:hypothetical protein